MPKKPRKHKMFFISDNLHDAAGTSLIAHTPQKGGPIVADFGAAKITDANRARGDGVIGGQFHYSAQPASQNWGIEFTLFIASYDGGMSFNAGGYTLSHTVSNGGWNLTGGNLPSPLFAGQDFEPGETHNCKLTSQDGVLTLYVDTLLILQAIDDTPPAVSQFGYVFFEQDTDSTGYHLASYVGYGVQTAPVIGFKGAVFG